MQVVVLAVQHIAALLSLDFHGLDDLSQRLVCILLVLQGHALESNQIGGAIALPHMGDSELIGTDDQSDSAANLCFSLKKLHYRPYYFAARPLPLSIALEPLNPKTLLCFRG